MNERNKFFQNGSLFHKNLYHPKINTCQFFTISANLESLYKPMCYRRPQSASVMPLLSGFAAAVKCQVKCHERSIWRYKFHVINMFNSLTLLLVRVMGQESACLYTFPPADEDLSILWSAKSVTTILSLQIGAAIISSLFPFGFVN